jgi:hypothetical protein
MKKYNLSTLKEKISPRTEEATKEKAKDRFLEADKTLGIEEILENKETAIAQKIIRKTFSIPKDELQLIDKIKEQALNNRIVLSESEAVRIGLVVAAKLDNNELTNIAQQITKLKPGRPKKY